LLRRPQQISRLGRMMQPFVADGMVDLLQTIGRAMRNGCKTRVHFVDASFAPNSAKERRDGYPTGRTNDWVKKTCAQRETLTIAGFALDGSKWDGLYVGRRKGNDLVYAGKVDHGFDQASAKRIAHNGIWVEPNLLAEIEYRAKSAEGKVRHPFFRGLRDDL
jgi:hypothetical protein